MAGSAETMVHHLLLQIAMLRKIAGAKNQAGGEAACTESKAAKTQVDQAHAILSHLRRGTIM